MFVDKIVVHCTDTPNGRVTSAEDVHRWHKERGFDGIGYHYLIDLEGFVEHGRPEYWTGAHVKGHNNNSIGICLVGRDHFNTRQLSALHQLIFSMLRRHPNAAVIGHNELDDKKTCPNFNVSQWWQGVRNG